MLDKGRVEKYEDKVSALHTELSNVLRATAKSYNHGDKYYQDYSNFIATLTTTFTNLNNFSEIQKNKHSKRLEEVRARIAKNEDLARNSGEYERAQTEEKLRQETLLEENRAKMRESLAKLDSKALAKLEPKKATQLSDFFEALAQIFYKESKEHEWAKWKKTITADNLDDFRRRLGEVDFANLTPEEADILGRMKDDPWLADYTNNNKQGPVIAGLTEYLVYVNQAIKANAEVKRISEEIIRNRIEAPKREELTKADQVSLEAIQRHIEYLTELHNKMRKSAEPFSDVNRKTDIMIGEYEKHKKDIRDHFFTTVAPVQAVPKGVYSEGI